MSRSLVLPGVLVAAMALVAASLVVATLRRPEPPSFAPTPPRPVEAGTRLVGPSRVTIDASRADRWVLFDFSRGAVVERPRPREWDLAFRRHEIGVNGGAGLAGDGGARALEGVAFDDVAVVPAEGYAASEPDTTHSVLGRWYDYGFTSHLLEPRPVVFAVRTADGRYAKVEVLSYYCPGARSGCVTFRYAYQGDGSRVVTPPER